MKKTSFVHRIAAAGLGVGALAMGLAPVMPGPLTAPAHAQAAASDLDRVVAALRGISTMTADFTQTDRNGQVLTGTLTLKKPVKLRVDRDDDFLITGRRHGFDYGRVRSAGSASYIAAAALAAGPRAWRDSGLDEAQRARLHAP